MSAQQKLIDPPVIRRTAADMRAALRGYRPLPEYALFNEVRNAAGFAANRSCDAITMGIWPSRGLRLEGYEIKVSRGDWLRELAEPAKAESFACYCDRWWIFAPAGVVKPEEVPENWGWIYLDEKDRVRVGKDAPVLTPQPLTRGFLAALLRRADESNEGELRRRLDDADRARGEQFSASVQKEVDRRTADLAELKELDAAVREAFGVEPRAWFMMSNVIDMVRFLKATHLHENWGGLPAVLKEIDALERRAADLAARMRDGLAVHGIVVEKATEPPPLGKRKRSSSPA